MEKSIMKFTKVLLIVILLSIGFVNIEAKNPVRSPSKKKGMIGRVKDAAAYGFGWQLGKEGAKAVIQKGKEIANSPKTKENLKKAKEKSKELIDNLKK
jgi:hypothetical protein